MTKFVNDAQLDAFLDSVANNVNAMHVCSGDPGDRAAVLTNSLGNVAIDNTDFSNANGDTSGRKATIAQQSIASASASGTAAHLCLIDGTELRLKTELPSQSITSGNPVTVNAFDLEIRDPI